MVYRIERSESVIIRMARKKERGGTNVIRQALSLKWVENYDKELDYIWSKIPWPLNKFLVFSAFFAIGISVSGYWVNLWVHFSRQLGYSNANHSFATEEVKWSFFQQRFKNFWIYLLAANAVSYLIYFGVGGFLHWYFYVRQRDRPHDWKCQPTKFLTPELERHEFLLGSFSMFFDATGSSILACYISNGGYSTVYYEFSEYGWTWFFLQFPVIFIYQDYLTYWMHRILHTPWLYKKFHKIHHKYKQPTVWSVTAFHPFETSFMQLVLVTPLFLFRIHWLPFYIVVLYAFLHGIRDHSGINFKSSWWQPWQPNSMFHDNHHQYFHVNFGFNIGLWDKLHGTYREDDRVYNEETFYGKGKSVKEATKKEIREYNKEKKSENSH